MKNLRLIMLAILFATSNMVWGQLSSINIGTGINPTTNQVLSNGSMDPKWRICDAPVQSGINNTFGGPAFVNAPHQNWVAPNGNSRWINFRRNSTKQFIRIDIL